MKSRPVDANRVLSWHYRSVIRNRLYRERL